MLVAVRKPSLPACRLPLGRTYTYIVTTTPTAAAAACISPSFQSRNE